MSAPETPWHTHHIRARSELCRKRHTLGFKGQGGLVCTPAGETTVESRAALSSCRRGRKHTGRRFHSESTLQDIETRAICPDLDL